MLCGGSWSRATDQPVCLVPATGAMSLSQIRYEWVVCASAGKAHAEGCLRRGIKQAEPGGDLWVPLR